MAVYDFSGSFRNLNSALSDLGGAFQEQRATDAYNQAMANQPGMVSLNTGVVQQPAASPGLNNLGRGSGVAPVANGAPVASVGSPNQVETRFMSGIREAGLTNPFGLATIAAYGKRESGWSPQNANRTWSDPSQSGQAGTSGGLFSWRNERLRNLHGFAQQRGENIGSITPETQAAFLASEDPTLIPRLNNAGSLAEANQIMANAWKFAGYEGNSPEYNARLQTAMAYLPRYQGGGNTIQRATGQPQPTMVAQAQTGATTPEMARAGIARVDMLLNDPNSGLTPVQRQGLEQRRERYVQVAQASQQSQPQADIPAQGAQQAAGFAVPGQSQQVSSGITPEQAQAAMRNIERVMGQKGLNDGQMRALALRYQQYQRYADPTVQMDLQNKQLTNQKMLLETQKLQREMEGEGAIPLSADQKKQFGIPDGQAAWLNRRGELKIGPGGTTVNNTIDNKIETEEGKERAKSTAKFLSGISDNAGQLAQRNADLDMLGRVISRTPTGAGADTRAFLDRIGAGLGLSSGKLATQADAIKAIVNRIAPTLRQVGSGAQSDTELRGFLSSLPSLTALPEGNQLIMSTLKRAANIERARAGVAARWQSGELSAGDARRQIAKIDEQSIFANDQERELVAGLFGSMPQTGKPVANSQGQKSSGWTVIGVE